MLVLSNNPSTWVVEAGGSGIQHQPQIHNKFKASLWYMVLHLKIKQSRIEMVHPICAWNLGEVVNPANVEGYYLELTICLIKT